MALVPLEEAVKAALALVTPGPVRAVEVAEAEGFLAEAVQAPMDVPGCDNSAMDGYAVRAEDTRGANRDRAARLKIVETIYAGMRPTRTLGPGEAARIFTGAAIPDGANAVVRQEAAGTVVDGVHRGARDSTGAPIAGASQAKRDQVSEEPAPSAVDVFIEAKLGEHIRRRGEEIRAGSQVFGVGTRVDAYVAGVLATLGLTRVKVYARPRVAILTVGDELVELGCEAAPHQVFNSNAVLLRGLCKDAGAEIVGTSRSSDDAAELERAIVSALEHCEVLITSGGASVGDRDRVKATLRKLGATFAVDGVALKPGKPVGVAQMGDGPKLAVVLPGNPGAASVAFDRFARPILLARQGMEEVRRRTRVRLDAARHKQSGLTYFLSARLGDDPSTVRVRPQGAGQLLQNVALDGWVVLPAGRADFSAGEWVAFEQLRGSAFLARDGSGPAASSGAPKQFADPREPARPGGLTAHAATDASPEVGRSALSRAPIAVSLIGWSGAGKTTLIERLITTLSARGRRVAVLKHTPDAHPLHKPGSDTERFERAGANGSALWSAGNVQLTSALEAEAAISALAYAANAELILVEGWKDGPLPKIELRAPDAEPLNRPGTIAVVSRDADLDALATLVEKQRWP